MIKHCFLVVVSLACWSGIASGQTSQPAEEVKPALHSAAEKTPASQPSQPPFFRLDYSGDIWTSPAMTGDWGGARTKLAEKGISFNVETLQTMQGNAHGGRDTTDAFRYGGHADFFLQFDTYRMGLWPGGYFKVGGETQWGEGVGNKVGSVAPPNFAPLLLYQPDNPGATALSEYYFMQFLSPKIGLIAGMVDLTTLPGGNEFFGDRYNQFMNTALWFNPVAFSTVPLAAMTAGAIYLPTDWLTGATLVVDSHGTPAYSGFESGLTSPHGATILQSLTFKIKPFGQEGHQRINFSYTTSDAYRLADLGRLALSGVAAPGSGRLNLPRIQAVGGSNVRLRDIVRRAVLSRLIEPSKHSGDWAFWYDFDQYFYTKPGDPTQGIGLFGSFGWSPGEFNPVGQFYSIGVGGKGLIPERKRDRYGVGYYFMNLSNDLPDILGVNAEQGAEVFYNIEVTPWLHITPDLQVIMQPGGSYRHDVAIVYGLRTQISF